MRRTILPIVVVTMLGLAPVQAQDGDDSLLNDDIVAGSSLLEQGAKILLRGLMAEVEPAIEDMALALKEAEPMLKELMTMIGDIRNYNPPEMLPNGDILIRRKTPAEQLADPSGEIEL
jgi:hypothetical protein